jgi:AbrB family looped-hinge helix DNA binding protein
MESTIKVDKQGRLVLPAGVRDRLRLGKSGGTVSIRLDGSRVVLQPVSEELEKRVEEWRGMVMALQVMPFAEDAGESWKWMSPEYARRKLGLS